MQRIALTPLVVKPLPILSSALSERQFSRFVLVSVVLGFVALLAAGAMTAYTVVRTQDHARWVEHTYAVEQRIDTMRALVERAETSRRGFLLSGDPTIRDTFVTVMRAEPAAVAAIHATTQDNPVQQANTRQLEQLIARHMVVLGRSVALAVRSPETARLSFIADGSLPLARAIRNRLQAMAAEEERLLAIRTAQQQAGIRSLFVVLAITGGLMLVVGVYSVAMIRRYTSNLVVTRDAVRLLNEELEERVEERTHELSRANEEIQRFAYIVSHDLRSPLVNVMGFTGELEAATRPLAALVERAEAEAPALVTEEARLAARADLPEAIGFIRASTQKMDRLINAILRLSREGKRVLTPEPIDLEGLVNGIVATNQHRLDESGTEITVETPMPAVTADRLAVEQMLSNLIENAVKYLKPGRPGRIVVTARAERGRVAIDVADNGRGIDPRDHDRIFDLFRRSGAQDQPGEGIGLAHVRALAYRIGGLVDCRSALDEGATFTLSLPAQPVASPVAQQG